MGLIDGFVVGFVVGFLKAQYAGMLPFLFPNTCQTNSAATVTATTTLLLPPTFLMPLLTIVEFYVPHLPLAAYSI